MKINYWLNQNRFLSHLRTSFCALATLGALVILSSAVADRPPPNATGDFYPCFTVTSQRQVGENLIVTFDISGSSTGTFTSTSTGVTGTEMDVVHPDGSITLHGSLLFTGSVNGRSGTMLFTYEGIGNAVTGHETLRFVGREGTGDLAGVYANLTAEGDVGEPPPGCNPPSIGGHGTYTGHVIFAP